ncbi:hypothetical protein [Actinophytocola xanthii]|uniref:Uncharacterized protein n=1 Tax=Actinophytocola xanthii TaxID=1912961 RepID=A0A1Q8CRD5_9PSEU|nr:hypothetical protein [Actinophytocola xanthii]OLF16897.1 hypothetical protein BU204_14450 [Actinophytocola xanthii]
MNRHTNRLGTVVGAALLLVLVGACGNPQENQNTAGDPRPTEVSTPTVSTPTSTEPDRQPARTPPSGAEKVPASQIDTAALPERYPVLVWTENDGRTVGVVAQEGGCGRASLEATQDAEQVVITMVETVPDDGRPCTMDLRYPKLTTELEQPLDQRTVVLRNEQRKG